MKFFALAARLLFLVSSYTASATANKRCSAGSTISVAGSSTVKPISEAWAAAYMALQCPDADVFVEGGGSSSGAGRVCGNLEKGEPVVIGDMSREWKESEAVQSSDKPFVYECRKGDTSRSVIQIDVAIDGISVTTKIGSSVSECLIMQGGLTNDQIRWIFSSYTDEELEVTGWDPLSLSNSDNNTSTHLWSELSPNCPAVEIKIAGPDAESGTYEYFKETILTDYENGEDFDFNRPTGYFNSEEDEKIVYYLADNQETIAFFGYSYYFLNQDKLVAIPILNADGNFVVPSPATVGDGTYNLLSRRIYMNLLNDPEALQHTFPFIEYGFSEAGNILVEGVGYVPIPEDEQAEMLSRITILFPEVENEVNEIELEETSSTHSLFSPSTEWAAMALMLGLAMTVLP